VPVNFAREDKPRTALDPDTALFAQPASDANAGRVYSISAPVPLPSAESGCAPPRETL